MSHYALSSGTGTNIQQNNLFLLNNIFVVAVMAASMPCFGIAAYLFFNCCKNTEVFVFSLQLNFESQSTKCFVSNDIS